MKLKLSTLATGVAVTVIGGLVLRQITGGGFSFGGGGGSFLPAATRADPTANLSPYSSPLGTPVSYTPRTYPRRNGGVTAPRFDPALVDISSVTSGGIFQSVY